MIQFFQIKYHKYDKLTKNIKTKLYKLSMPNQRVGGKKNRVISIGAGIGGLTAGALLAHRGYDVLMLDQAIVPGGCASSFKRQGFTFDVGATQVAGLEPGGIHHRIFTELGIDLPPATPCDPSCTVYLPGETQPINVWRKPEKWQQERQKQFPGSEPFWQLLSNLFKASWEFQQLDPVLIPRSLWDLLQLTKAIRPSTLITIPYTLSTVGDALRLYGLGNDKRLRTFLDLQLKLYSQVNAEETALLYAATALSISQEPQGLYHLHGSMQTLSDRLVSSFERDSGKLLMRHTVKSIQVERGKAKGVVICNQRTGKVWTEAADYIVANVTVQNLVKLMGKQTPSGYRQRVMKLHPPSGAFVVYLGVEEMAIPPKCPLHLQFMYDEDSQTREDNSLFVSVSHPGDGRAPKGKATIVASSFVDTELWNKSLSYTDLKSKYTDKTITHLSKLFKLTPETVVYQEAATPLTFARFTGRDKGFVGGIGQRLSTFGPFGFANRTPIKNLLLVGDSTHPGEGTAGVSYSAITAVKQIEHE